MANYRYFCSILNFMDKEQLQIVSQELQKPAKRAKAFADLVRLTQERLYWHIRKMVLDHEDANDILQNTFIKAWKGLDNFRGESQIFTWLYRIATNESLTFLASQRMKNVVSSSDFEDVLFDKLSADSYFDGDEAAEKLQKAILTPPEKQRLVFNMKYYDDITYEEMSEILGHSAGAVKVTYQHSVKK